MNKFKRARSRSSALVVVMTLIGSLANPVGAEIIRVGYQALAKTVVGQPFGLTVPLDTPVTGDFQYNTGTADSNTSTNSGTYVHGSGGGFVADFLGHQVSGSATPTWTVTRHDTLRIYDGPRSISFQGGIMSFDATPDDEIQLFFAITPGDDGLLSNDDLPNPWPAFDFGFLGDPHTFTISSSTNESHIMLLQITSAQQVEVEQDGDGYKTSEGDCDDSNPDVHPGAVETCNGIDDDCNDQIDDGLDTDGDTVTDICDNCPNVANTGQEDIDGDGTGDACDLDNDNDGVLDETDNCPTVSNPDQEDLNDDGIGDACTHDLAVIKMKAPKKITLSATVTNVVGKFSVSIQNRSPHNEVITNMGILTNLVTVSVQSLSNCPSFFATVLPPKATFPITLLPKKSLTLAFTAAFSCANDPLATSKTDAHGDYHIIATVHHEAIDGITDSHSEDDNCPHAALPGGVDPIDGSADKGCGGKNPDGTLGADVLTDVIMK